ncbi:MAG: LmeA family phospholipid-binding protein [Firmicutes bacterium]|nr:LmeA family phospholipid-binding protein [Bacillota bacterium]
MRQSLILAVLVFVVLIATLIAAAQVWIPGVVERRIVAGIEDSVDSVESLHVKVRSFPAALIPLGRIDVLEIDASRVKIKDLLIQRIFLDARHIQLDTREAFFGHEASGAGSRSGSGPAAGAGAETGTETGAAKGGAGTARANIPLRFVRNGHVTVILAEKDINDYFKRQDGILKILSVRLRRNYATVSGSVPLLGGTLDLELEGRFDVDGKTRIRYVINRFLVQDITVPKFIQDQLFGGLIYP